MTDLAGKATPMVDLAGKATTAINPILAATKKGEGDRAGPARQGLRWIGSEGV